LQLIKYLLYLTNRIPLGSDLSYIIGVYTLEDLKRHVFNLQGSGTSEDLKHSTPSGAVLNLHRYKSAKI
jgi:hypothetical protein